ncbi:MAG: hypothetical protein H0U03_04315 [Actinobacteria bacterium]|nr:hypothetical protein [Actinomycetota bacterium]
MRSPLVLACFAASVLVAAVVAWSLDLSLESLAVLAPVIVLSCAAGIGLVVLWTRIALESLRGREQPPAE